MKGIHKNSPKKIVKAKQEGQLLLTRAKDAITKRLVSAGVLVVVGLMIFNITGLVGAENNGNTSVNLVVATGSLEITNVLATATFTSGESGTASTENVVLNNTVIRDWRAVPNVFNLYANASNLDGGSVYNIASSAMTIYGSTIDLNEVEGNFNVADVNLGTNGTLNGNVGLLNSGANTAGAVGLHNMIINASLNALLTANTYTGTLKYTLVSV